jgi:hypothetical protein
MDATDSYNTVLTEKKTFYKDVSYASDPRQRLRPMKQNSTGWPSCLVRELFYLRPYEHSNPFIGGGGFLKY